MIALRPSNERGRTKWEWLDSFHTFSFGEYSDRRFHGFQDLRVINEDFVPPGQGFGMHPHRDMEIITYIVDGALQHRDNLGNGSVIRRGDVQRMTAGTGILHSEFNPSDTEPVHLLQIWIHPERRGLVPDYEERHFPEEDRTGKLRLIVSTDGRDSSVLINQNVSLFAGTIQAGQSHEQTFAAARHGWIQVVRGEIETAQNTRLAAGDGLSISDEPAISFKALSDAELLLFDLP